VKTSGNIRMPTEREWRTAMRLLERLANPSGNWRDDEARRLAKKFIKKKQMKNE
jgi:hypothetical protein